MTMMPNLFRKPVLLTLAKSPYCILGIHRRLRESLQMTCRSGQDNYPSPITILFCFPKFRTSQHDSKIACHHIFCLFLSSSSRHQRRSSQNGRGTMLRQAHIAVTLLGERSILNSNRKSLAITNSNTYRKTRRTLCADKCGACKR